jgi:hypothetical protein
VLKSRRTVRNRGASDVPLARTLLEYTNLYIRFGLGQVISVEAPLLDFCEFYGV